MRRISPGVLLVTAGFAAAPGAAGLRAGDVTRRRVAQHLGQAADNDRERDAEDEHGLLDAEMAQQVLRRRREIHRREAKARHHQTRDQAGLGGRKPLQRGRRGRRVAEADADARQHAEAEQPEAVAVRGRDEHEARADQQAADGGGEARAEFVLAAAGQDHREGEDQAAQRVGIVELFGFPAELLFDGALEQAPSVENAEREVDASAGERDHPAAIGRGLFRNVAVNARPAPVNVCTLISRFLSPFPELTWLIAYLAKQTARHSVYRNRLGNSVTAVPRTRHRAASPLEV